MVPLLAPLAALVAGILTAPYLEPKAVWLCILPSFLLSLARRWGVLLLFVLIGAGLRSCEPVVPPEPGNDPVRLIGRIGKAPEWRGIGVYLDVQLESIDGRPYHGRARLTEFLDDDELRKMFNALDLGSRDRVEIVVKLHRPVVYRNPGVFNYRRHLERQGIYWTGTIRNPRLITILERGWHGPDRIKAWVRGKLERAFAADRVARALVLGMVLGQKHRLPAEVERQFQEGGLYHLLVVSGFNLAVVAGTAMWLARRLPKRSLRFWLVLVAAVAYAFLVEGEAPVVRATLMAGFLVMGRLLDRGYAVANSLIGTALILLLIEPTSLEDPSFQMTFAAVIAIVGIAVPAIHWSLGWLRVALRNLDDTTIDGRLDPAIADWRVSRRLWCELHGLPLWAIRVPWRITLILGELAIVSASVQMVFVVFMVESFHRISPVAPLLNVVAGPIAAVVTPAGLLLPALPEYLTGPLAWIVRKLLMFLMAAVDFALELPAATLRVPSPPLWVWVVYSIAISAVILAIWKRWRPLLAGGAVSVVALQWTIAVADFSPTPPRDVTLTFLDVGQGDSTLIEFPNGKRMVIDGGGVTAGRFLALRDESTFSIGESVISPYLFSRGIRRIDTLVLTHAHHDHLDGLFALIENFEVGEVWLGRNPMIPRYREFLERVMSHQIPIRWVSAGQRIGPFEVLHPPADWRPRKTAQNNDSVVLLLRVGERTALLAGDIEMRIPTPPWVNVLKVPHHGSKNARLRVGAGVGIISVGANNPFGHPHVRGLRTDQLGAIEVKLHRGGAEARRAK